MFTFNPLWKLLIDKGLNREDLKEKLNFSPSTMAKMSKGQYVSLEVLHRLCAYLDCQLSDMIQYVPSPVDGESNKE